MLSPHSGAEQVRRIVQDAPEHSAADADVIEIAPRDFPAIDDVAFIDLPGEIVRMIEPHTESDRVAILMNLHAFFGNAVGRGPHYRVEGSSHGPNLFVLQIG